MTQLQHHFNPPPNWPPMPPGWTPPPGWTSPDDWPTPPAGWQFWTTHPPQIRPPSWVSQHQGLVAALATGGGVLLIIMFVAAALSGPPAEPASQAADQRTSAPKAKAPTTAPTKPPAVTSKAPAASDMDWSPYAPAVRTRIERLIAAKDCSGLQKEFDIADQNDAAQRARTGTGNADLMSYLDRQMRAVNCY